MIIVKIIGGLGNQMFQYALGRHLSERLRVPFKLDISGFEKYKLRVYGLNVFNILENIASQEEIEQIIGKGLFGKFCRWIDRRKRIFKRHFIIEQDLGFEPDILKLSSENVYLDGYWQSEKYFFAIRDILLQDFTVIPELKGKNKEVTDQISNTNSVSLHIRRGDYIANQNTNQFHGTCNLDYYYNARNQILKTVTNPHFFIFSDDPTWCKDNLKLKSPMTFVTYNDDKTNYEDLRLMSLCKHNIIANSSFSWWGAWLNKNPEKIVIAPQKWFNDLEIDTTDLIPESWVRI